MKMIHLHVEFPCFAVLLLCENVNAVFDFTTDGALQNLVAVFGNPDDAILAVP